MALAMPAFAANGDVSRDDLEKLEAERDAALEALQALETASGETASDLEGLERKLIAAAMESQRREEQATASELKLVSLRARQSSAKRDLVENETALDSLMASLAVSGRHRPPALVTNPGDANAAIRAAILMGYTTPQVKDQTHALAEEITDLRKLEQQVLREVARLEAAEAALSLKKAEILQMTATKRAAFEDVNGDLSVLRDRVTLLGREADTIRGLLAALEANAPAAPAIKPNLQFAAASPNAGIRSDAPRTPVPRQATTPGRALIGGLLQPAAGRLVRKWGDTMPGGSKSEGLAFATRAEAQVTAPVDGKVEFSGPFRTYGQLLILSTSDDYHVLLSGMSDTYVEVGQTVKRGEPVARMTQRVMPEPELYMEVRKQGKPMNPANWMTRG
ncbi:MAG: peptidoglycan DD-metalloendopeptidase family protein [Henriciella sp.]|nr:peptidoglycan DD-metalloendopeptidase family protein [Henriciella sp.]